MGNFWKDFSEAKGETTFLGLLTELSACDVWNCSNHLTLREVRAQGHDRMVGKRERNMGSTTKLWR